MKRVLLIFATERLLLIFAMVLALAGCGVMQELGIDSAPLPVSQALPPLGQTAQRAVNEANGLLASLAIVVHQDRLSGFITLEKELEYKREFQQHGQTLDRFQDAIDLCLKEPNKCVLIGDAEQRVS
jgi:hypothetical protein